MIILVTGGRDYADRDCVFQTLFMVTFRCWLERQPVYLMHGACGWDSDPAKLAFAKESDLRGADGLADEWAREAKLPSQALIRCPAPWTKLGPAAGPHRNYGMVQSLAMHIDPVKICVAFPGGRGTQGCVREVRAAGGIRIFEVS